MSRLTVVLLDSFLGRNSAIEKHHWKVVDDDSRGRYGLSRPRTILHGPTSTTLAVIQRLAEANFNAVQVLGRHVNSLCPSTFPSQAMNVGNTILFRAGVSDICYLPG